jgi:transcriptional regulator with PAS, ATPase and Fis domain
MFRNDLYYRLKVISFFLPPLSERRDDINPLLEFYLDYYNKFFHKNISKISKEAMEVFNEYNWPGNIRELRNVIERIVLLEEDDEIALSHIPIEMLSLPKVKMKQNILQEMDDEDYLKTLVEMEKIYIKKTLKAYDYNKTKAAKSLGISRKTLWDKLKKYKIGN